MNSVLYDDAITPNLDIKQSISLVLGEDATTLQLDLVQDGGDRDKARIQAGFYNLNAKKYQSEKEKRFF